MAKTMTIRLKVCEFLTLQFIILSCIVNNYSEAATIQNHTSQLPTCSIELQNQTNGEYVTVNTMDLTGSTGQNIICGVPFPISDNFTDVLLNCHQNVIHINAKGIARVNITCQDNNPLQYSQDKAPPFLGVDVAFSKKFISNGSLQHAVSATFPETRTSPPYEEGLEVYSGVYKMSREKPEKWEVRIQLNIRSGEGAKMQKECFEVVDDSMECEVGHSESDVYLVNIGGDNPTETQLKASCLDASVKNACGNKFPGTNCVQNRYCKKLSHIHHNGMARCSYDNVTQDIEYFRDIIHGDIHTNMSKMWDHRLILKIERDNDKDEFVITFPEDDENATTVEHPDDENATTVEHPDDENATTVEHPECGDVLTVYPIQQDEETLFDQEETKFECHFSPYFLVPPVLWLVEWSNGSTLRHSIDDGGNITKEKRMFDGGERYINFPVKSSHVQIKASLGMVNITCEMMYWNSSVIARNVQPVIVKESKTPEFQVSNEVILTKYIDESLELKCQVKEDVQPQPKFEWKFQGKVLVEETESELKLPKLGTSQSGTYECTAHNFRGKASKTFQVHVVDPVKRMWMIVGTILIGMVIILGLILAALYKVFLKQRARLSAAEIKEFMNGNGQKGQDNDYENINTKGMAYNRDYEVSWNQMQLESQELGKGVHGVVFKGKLGEMPIAVKTVREGVTKDVLMALLDELKIMAYLGTHDHVVTLKGACTQFLEEGRAYVLVEFCPLGSMESFLRKNKDFLVNKVLGSGYTNISSSKAGQSMSADNVTQQHFINWSYQIAKGMKYLEEKKVIHADLAIRNILMTSIDHVKITDFGLSRQLINTNTYVKTHQALLPWKYMAPESLSHFIFTSKSDVWSYGVTLWEIFTVGSTPYPGMSWTAEFSQLLEENMRLFRPKHAPEEMYNLMMKCWELEPKGRPSFAELEMVMQEMM